LRSQQIGEEIQNASLEREADSDEFDENTEETGATWKITDGNSPTKQEQ